MQLNRKAGILLVAVVFQLIGVSAQAGFVSFRVDPVSLQVLAKNFTVQRMQAFLRCVFIDNSRIFKSYPEKELVLTYREIENHTDESGTLFQVDVEGGKLSYWHLLKDVFACDYVLIVVDKELSNDWSIVSSYTNLIDSRDDEYQHQKLSPIKSFLADRELSRKISSRYRPLKLEEKEGNRVERVQ